MTTPEADKKSLMSGLSWRFVWRSARLQIATALPRHLQAKGVPREVAGGGKFRAFAV